MMNTQLLEARPSCTIVYVRCSVHCCYICMYECTLIRMYVQSYNILRQYGDITLTNGIRNIMEDQYPPIYLSIILKSYLARKRRLADGDTKRKLADTQTDTLT